MITTGIGFDIHPLVKGRRLVLGGVAVPHAKGLAGHSDADVLTHAVCDALLGAAGKGDIGRIYLATDPRWKNASSLKFLEDVMRRIKPRRPVHVDAVLIAEEPRLAPHIDVIAARLRKILKLPAAHVNVKAKHAERIGDIGRGRGIAAMVVATVR